MLIRGAMPSRGFLDSVIQNHLVKIQEDKSGKFTKQVKVKLNCSSVLNN